MIEKVGKFSFTVPDGHAQAGEKIEKAFTYQECESEAEAAQVIADKKWNIVRMVNDTLKSAARSNSYQAALLPYRPSEVSPDEIRERIIRDLIRSGMSEEIARQQVEAMLSTPTASDSE